MHFKFALPFLLLGCIVPLILGETLYSFSNDEIILMIDTSGSVTTQEYELEVEVAQKLMSYIDEEVYINLFLSHTQYAETSIPATEQNKEILIERITNRKGGDQDLDLSLGFSLPKKDGYQSIIVVIAGDDDDYYNQHDSIKLLIQQNPATKIVYFDILAEHTYSHDYVDLSHGEYNFITSFSEIDSLSAKDFGASTENPCKIGEYENADEECISCPINYSCPNGKSLVLCTDGFYTNSTEESGCNECLAGYYCTNGGIEECSDNYYSFTGSTACTLCPFNYACEDKYSEPTKCDDDSYSFLGDTECHNNRIIIAEDDASFNLTAIDEYIDSISNPTIEGEETSQNVFETTLTLDNPDSSVTNIYAIPEVKDVDGNTVTINYGYFYHSKGSKTIKITLIQNSNNLENFLISSNHGEKILSFLIKYSFYSSIDNSLLHVHQVKIKITVTETSSDSANFEVNAYEENVGDYALNTKVASLIKFCIDWPDCEIETATKESPEKIYFNDNLHLIHYLELEQYRENYIMNRLEITISYSSYTLNITEFVNASCVSGSDCLGSILLSLPMMVRDDSLEVTIVSKIAHKNSVRRELSSLEGVSTNIGPFRILEKIINISGSEKENNEENWYIYLYIGILVLVAILMGLAICLVYRCVKKKSKALKEPAVSTSPIPNPKDPSESSLPVDFECISIVERKYLDHEKVPTQEQIQNLPSQIRQQISSRSSNQEPLPEFMSFTCEQKSSNTLKNNSR